MSISNSGKCSWRRIKHCGQPLFSFRKENERKLFGHQVLSQDLGNTTKQKVFEIRLSVRGKFLHYIYSFLSFCFRRLKHSNVAVVFGVLDPMVDEAGISSCLIMECADNNLYDAAVMRSKGPKVSWKTTTVN